MALKYEPKLNKLKEYLKELSKNGNKIAVAFSAGVDSTFLLKIAHDTLGENVIAITAGSFLIPNREIEETNLFCAKENIKHIVFDFKPIDVRGFKENPRNRCYICKSELFKNIIEIAKENGANIVIEGSNIDDLSDFRPGLQALKELDIKSPLQYLELTKQEIRELSHTFGLKTYNKPSYACLASRFPYNEIITEEKLKIVDNAENFLFEEGFKQFRVRTHQESKNYVARIEVLPDEFDKLLQVKEILVQKFKEFGFDYITFDLEGYKTGNLNKNRRV